MEVRIAAGKCPTGRVAVGVFAEQKAPWRSVPAELGAAVRAAVRAAGWKGGEGQRVQREAAGSRRLEVHGLGASAEFEPRKLRSFVEAAVDAAKAAGERRLTLVVPDHPVSRGAAASERTARWAALAGYRFDEFLSNRSESPLGAVTLWVPAAVRGEWSSGAATAAAIAAGVERARDLANTPPNVATPEWMAERARDLAREHGGRATVLGPAELAKRGMGGILAVGGGSSHPPRMVRLELGRGRRTVALVGKGVTFDTGGISIKPAASMEEMKWDKSGACTVLGVVDAVARLGLDVRLRAYLALAENMPDGSAYRPGDIVRCANGKTVEIVNTDAEGRMILADALSWASTEAPDHLLELSTLTGACVVALGQTGAGLFTPDDGLADALLAAADGAGERLWRLPLWSEFLDDMRGSHSDLKNSGPRWGGASTAAAFLSQFAAPLASWAHLDIAGPAYVGEGRSRRGATGYGVAAICHWLSTLARG